MKIDQLDLFLDCLKKIVASDNLSVVPNAWKTLEELESNENLERTPVIIVIAITYSPWKRSSILVRIMLCTFKFKHVSKNKLLVKV